MAGARPRRSAHWWLRNPPQNLEARKAGRLGMTTFLTDAIRSSASPFLRIGQNSRRPSEKWMEEERPRPKKEGRKGEGKVKARERNGEEEG